MQFDRVEVSRLFFWILMVASVAIALVIALLMARAEARDGLPVSRFEQIAHVTIAWPAITIGVLFVLMVVALSVVVVIQSFSR
jgi:uncharacterized membrane protein